MNDLTMAYSYELRRNMNRDANTTAGDRAWPATPQRNAWGFEAQRLVARAAAMIQALVPTRVPEQCCAQA